MSELHQITCIVCPVGCRMDVTLQDGQFVSVSGNTCKRGEAYARQESVQPTRMVTAVAHVIGSAVPVSLKTQQPIPKDKIAQCMEEINSLQLELPITSGDVLKENVAGTGVNLVATRTLR
jgi:CxxC motif-containing protein